MTIPGPGSHLAGRAQQGGRTEGLLKARPANPGEAPGKGLRASHPAGMLPGMPPSHPGWRPPPPLPEPTPPSRPDPSPPSRGRAEPAPRPPHGEGTFPPPAEQQPGRRPATPGSSKTRERGVKKNHQPGAGAASGEGLGGPGIAGRARLRAAR